MRIGSLGVVALLAAAAVACKSSDEAAGPRKLRKMDFHTTIDDRGRLKIAFRLFDAKHEQMPVTGSYTAEVTKLDGTLLCKAAGELLPADFSEKGTHQAPWHEAGCPADPGADEVKVNVKVTVPAAGADKGKDDKSAAKDTVFDRSVTIPVRSIYERPPAKQPAASSAAAGSATMSSAAAGSATSSATMSSAAIGSAAIGSAAAGSAAAGCSVGSAAVGSAAIGGPADGCSVKSAEKPAEAKPTAEKPAERRTAEKPAGAKPAAGSAR